jgi:hypothetical protein
MGESLNLGRSHFDQAGYEASMGFVLGYPVSNRGIMARVDESHINQTGNESSVGLVLDFPKCG